MSVYTLKMNLIDKPNSFEFCKDNGYIGFGWGIPDIYGVVNSIDDYKLIRKNNGLYANCKELTKSINAFNEMKKGDFIWTLDSSALTAKYYLCKISGEYVHLNEEHSDKFGIANCMLCEYLYIGSADLVPRSVMRPLHSNGIIYKLKDIKEQETAELLYKANDLIKV